MKFIDDKSPMPSGVHSTVILPDQVEHDIAGQTMTNTLTRNTMDNIYMGSSITLPSNHEKQNQRRSRPKVRNAVILLIFGFVGIVIGAILRAFLSSQSQSQGSILVKDQALILKRKLPMMMCHLCPLQTRIQW
jgi:hypothetical protein